jgi:hypothetical protein
MDLVLPPRAAREATRGEHLQCVPDDLDVPLIWKIVRNRSILSTRWATRMDYRKSKQQARLKNRVPYRYTDDAETLAHDSDTTNKGHDRTRVRTYEHVHVVHHHHEVAGIHSWLIDRRRCITRNENHKQYRRVGLHGNHPHLTSLLTYISSWRWTSIAVDSAERDRLRGEESSL